MNTNKSVNKICKHTYLTNLKSTRLEIIANPETIGKYIGIMPAIMNSINHNISYPIYLVSDEFIEYYTN